jgi:exodeoxyribonuclease VII large subunit
MDAPLSVKRFLDQLKARIEPSYANLCLIGEVSNFRGSGKHWYFTLKEEGASLQCAVWASQQRSLGHAPRDGQRLILKGALNVYVGGGSLTFAVTHAELAGLGDLQSHLRQREAELRSEGIFDRVKRPLPTMPKKIAIIAALGGAALQDVLKVTALRAPGIDVLIFPAAAQGERCVPENLLMLQEAQDEHWGCQVILLVRGGGSMEDLWGFNDPELVRAASASRIPIVSGVGHEIDVTLVDLAADQRAATPSQAAEWATPDRQRLQSMLRRLEEALVSRMDWRLRNLESSLNLLVDGAGFRDLREQVLRHHLNMQTLLARLSGAHPSRRMSLALQRLNSLTHRLKRSQDVILQEADRARIAFSTRHLISIMERKVRTPRERLAILAERFRGLDPKGPLRRGFVLALDEEGRPIVSAHVLPRLARLSLQWLDGSRDAKLES